MSVAARRVMMDWASSQGAGDVNGAMARVLAARGRECRKETEFPSRSSHRWEQKRSQRWAPIQTTRTMGGRQLLSPVAASPNTGSLALLCFASQVRNPPPLSAWQRLRTQTPKSQCAHHPRKYSLLYFGPSKGKSVAAAPKDGDGRVVVCLVARDAGMFCRASTKTIRWRAKWKLEASWELSCRVEVMAGKRFSQAQKWNRSRFIMLGNVSSSSGSCSWSCSCAVVVVRVGSDFARLSGTQRKAIRSAGRARATEMLWSRC